MSPEEAAARLGGGPGVGGDTGGGALRKVRVRAATRTVRIIGDPGVSEVAVEGLHEVRREGDTLVVSAHPAEGGGGFAFVPQDLGRLMAEGKAKARAAAHHAAREAARVAYAAGRPSWAPPGRGAAGQGWMGGPGRMGWGRPGGADHPAGTAGSSAGSPWPDWFEFQRWVEPLVVRVNPRLAVDADVSAGSLELSGVRGAVNVDVSFASASLEGVCGPLDVRAQAATVRIKGAVTQGTSSVRGDAAALFVTLAAGSDVTVRSRCELGRLRAVRGEQVLSPGEDLVVGRGSASLDIEASMGSVEVRVEEASKS